MKNSVKFFFCLLFTGWLTSDNISTAQIDSIPHAQGRKLASPDIKVGAEKLDEYLPLLLKTKIAVVANQTSLVGRVHLVDTLIRSGVKIKCVFAPEHGFRGNSGPGDEIRNFRDAATGLPIVSLYGKQVKPSVKDLEGVSTVVFDIQDVGARFYTYISTLQYVMEACAEQHKQLIVLDRPNPNGFYIDGPVMDPKFRSFVGMNRIPVVHGLTLGEYARMLNGEKWLKNGEQCKLKIVGITGYSHRDYYQLPVAPSPNLPNMEAVYLYPSLCFFEGTRVSVGRGTYLPFQWIGYPGFQEGDLAVTPRSMEGIISHPPYQDTLCNGLELQRGQATREFPSRQLNLQFLIRMFESYPVKDKFFNSFFCKLAGTDELQLQLLNGKPEGTIRESWRKALTGYKQMRKKYLLYEDFE